MARSSEDADDGFPDFGDNVDREVFDQILEMDEDEEREFSSGIVLGFLDQAESTFKSMDAALKTKNLLELSHLGHFLKGSSATLGFNKVKDECEKIQHYGSKKDETGTVNEPDEEKCLRLISESLAVAKTGYEAVAVQMRSFYEAIEANR